MCVGTVLLGFCGKGLNLVSRLCLCARRWSVDSDLEEEDVDGARAVNVDDLNSTSLFQVSVVRSREDSEWRIAPLTSSSPY